MAEKRKLQIEIDKTMKRVDEGIEEFDSIFTKINATGNQSQKEKLENELKREIKKLQRFRDQIKVWQASSDVKDKMPLDDARRKIEKEMERFKVCEREFKMKAFSKEGLAAKAKMEPHEEQRCKHRDWINDIITKLSTSVDQYEAEAEILLNKKGKNKNDNDKINELQNWVMRHNWHLQKLEQILRRLENDTINMNLLDDIKEGIDYYVECHEESGFYFDENLYADLKLEEPEEASDSGGQKESDDLHSEALEDEGVNSDSVNETKEKSNEKVKNVSEEKPKIASNENSNSNINSFGSSSSFSSSTNTLQSTSSSLVLSSIMADINNNSNNSMHNNSKATTDISSSSTLINSNNGSVHTHGSSSTCSALNSNKQESSSPSSFVSCEASVGFSSSSSDISASPALVSPSSSPVPSSSSFSSSSFSSSSFLPRGRGAPLHDRRNTNPATSVHVSPSNCAMEGRSRSVGGGPSRSSSASSSSSIQSPHITASCNNDSNISFSSSFSNTNSPNEQKEKEINANDQNENNEDELLANKHIETDKKNDENELAEEKQEEGEIKEGKEEEIKDIQENKEKESSVNDEHKNTNNEENGREELSEEARKNKNETNNNNNVPRISNNISYPLYFDGMEGLLDSSYRNCPTKNDSERNRPPPSNRLTISNPHPAFPLTAMQNSDTQQYFRKMDLDTLFFVFYYQQGTYQQYLAAKELKKQAWRFHKKYSTWFQRRDEPKVASEKFEQGAYFFFDYESSWTARVKPDFTFEYQWLEDEVPV